MLLKIKKLLALAESSNVAEASSAMQKAHSLLKEHNLSITDIKEDSVYSILEEDYFSGSRERAWRTQLIAVVARANYCECLKTVRGSSFSLKLVGKEHNISASRILLDYLSAVIERLAKNLEAKMRESYKLGVVNTLEKRLAMIIEEEKQECTSLVVQEKSCLDQYFKGKNVKTKDISISVRNASAYYKGCKDGNSISLNKQVDSAVPTAQMAIA